jgi:cytochrome b subunit of formate dehydrogenase
MLLVSVGLLFLSGIFLFGLRYPGAEWALALTGALGGVDFWRVIHRIGGSLLILAAAYHLAYSLLHEDGRRDFVLMLPRGKDFVHLGQNLRYFFGASATPPDFGRFTYFEKFDYWAVFWGCVAMIGSGLAMWFPRLVLAVFPGLTPAAFNAFKEAHAHEAVLAFLAIIIWHSYNVHLRPGRFPGAWSWVHGHITDEEQAHEHPAVRW